MVLFESEFEILSLKKECVQNNIIPRTQVFGVSLEIRGIPNTHPTSDDFPNTMSF